MRTALHEDDPFDLRPAVRTRITGAAVDTMGQLKTSLSPIGIHVIGDRRTAAFDRFGQHFAHGIVNAFDSILS